LLRVKVDDDDDVFHIVEYMLAIRAICRLDSEERGIRNRAVLVVCFDYIHFSSVRGAELTVRLVHVFRELAQLLPVTTLSVTAEQGVEYRIASRIGNILRMWSSTQELWVYPTLPMRLM